MLTRVRRPIVAALMLATCLLSTGCNLFKDTTYTMDVVPVGSVEEQLQSLYVIVAPRDEVAEPLSDRSRYSELVDEDRIRRYTSFVQYQPDGAGSWRDNYTGNQSSYVKYAVKGDTIKIKVEHALIDKGSSTIFNLVALAFFGKEGFQVETISYSDLNASADYVLQVGSGTLSLRPKE
ncbi:MAG: hypothetical protein R3F34_12250 [Planctomycetota bacterium]